MSFLASSQSLFAAHRMLKAHVPDWKGIRPDHLLCLESFHGYNKLVLSIAGDMLMTFKNHLWLLLKVI